MQLSIEQMRQGLLSGDFCSVELTKSHLERIKATNKDFNSFLLVDEAGALKAAQEADSKIKDQAAATPLMCGIPISIKDMLVTKGLETTCASKILKGFIPPYDGTAVANLKKDGAVILGKTNLDEFAMGSSNENSAYGNVKNPWDTQRVPGGSSGGSAVSVSLGQAPVSLGTDTGGSIRQPAALCGIYGLKPTYGRVSRYGAVAFASSLDQIGPFARTVEDLAITLESIGGYDPKDSTSLNEPVAGLYQAVKDFDAEEIKNMTFGVPKEYFSEHVDAEVKESVNKILDQLKAAGATVKEVSLPQTNNALAVYYVLAPAEASSNLSRYDGIRYGQRSEAATNLEETYALSRAEGFGEEVKRRIILGTYVLSAGYYDAYYLKAQKVRTLIIEDFKRVFSSGVDVIISATSPTTAFKIGDRCEDPLKMYAADLLTIPASLAGLPALSMPSGLDSSKLPIGLQLIGPALGEESILKASKAISQFNKFDCFGYE